MSNSPFSLSAKVSYKYEMEDQSSKRFLLHDGLLGLLNMFTGGAFSQASIMALGIMPYISSWIEHLPSKEAVEGSNPSGLTLKPHRNVGFFG